MTKFTHKASGSVIYGTVTAKGSSWADVELDGISARAITIQTDEWKESRELPTHDGAVIRWGAPEWPAFALLTRGQWRLYDGEKKTPDEMRAYLDEVEWVEYKPAKGGHEHMRTVDYDEALEILRDVVKGREDYVYEKPDSALGCVNYTETPDGERVPSCVVGHVYARLGVLDKVFPGMPVRRAVEFGCFRDELDLTEKAVKLLEFSQHFQDSGEPWGKALEAAVELVEGVEE